MSKAAFEVYYSDVSTHIFNSANILDSKKAQSILLGWFFKTEKSFKNYYLLILVFAKRFLKNTFRSEKVLVF